MNWTSGVQKDQGKIVGWELKVPRIEKKRKPTRPARFEIELNCQATPSLHRYIRLFKLQQEFIIKTYHLYYSIKTKLVGSLGTKGIPTIGAGQFCFQHGNDDCHTRFRAAC